ncbi:SDR family oxidoreductase [Polynucleobacter paneuropaeus]|jgi:3-oxoacyl-[acyl-carrier protein] reductase|nr:SDR family oxidoreductase [Polynucleobacter paneuropaeus]
MLDNKVALVTGCSRGIGNSIARKFAENGAVVYANAKTDGSLVSLASQSYGSGIIIPIYFDVTDRVAVKEAIVRIKSEQGRLDCLVNNAGILVDTLITMLDRKTLREIYEVNVFSLFDLMSFAARLMTQKKSGSIINIASICGDEGGMRGQTAYSSSKGAVIALTKTAAKELGQLNVRVNCVSPGFIDTDMFRSGPAAIQDQLTRGVYLEGRVGTPDEVANVCLFLASDLSSYVNGENIRVDGFAHI